MSVPIATEEVAEPGASRDLRDEPWPVQRTLAALARLLGATVELPPANLDSFVASRLGVGAGGIASVTTPLLGIDVDLVHVAVGRLLEAVPHAELTDDTGSGAPGFDLVTVDVDEQVSAPNDLAAYLPAGAAFPFDTVLVLTWRGRAAVIGLRVRRADHGGARVALSRLVANARGGGNFYRGKTLRVRADDHGIELTAVPPSRARRVAVVHPAPVWAEIDATVGGLVRNAPVLAEAGLGASRGILIAGPPGVGKTALCRVIAAEQPEGTTILLVDAAVSAAGLGRIYEAVRQLAPAAIFLDDLDLLTGDRRAGPASPALRQFLTQLDGFVPSAAVLTVATTNVPDAIDPALIRPGRFDSVIEIGPPNAAARTLILRRYLRAFAELDLGPVVAATQGASGADLREIVRRAVLEHGRDLTTRRLMEIVSGGRWAPAASVGQYL